MAPLENIMPELNARGIKIVEDTAQSLGSYRQINEENKFAGTIGDIGVFSFFPTKNLGGAGDSGMIYSQKIEFGERLKKLRVHGAKRNISAKRLG